MSDKTCKTCKFFESADPIYDHNRLVTDGYCRRYPSVTPIRADRWCGEWTASEVTDDYYTLTKVADEYTLTNGFGERVFRVTSREDGTSTTEPAPERALLNENAILRELVLELWQLHMDYNDPLDREQMQREMQARDHLREVGVIE